MEHVESVVRVGELRNRLAELPDDVEVAVAAHVVAASVTDVAPTGLVGVDHGRGDDGAVTAVWLVAIRDAGDVGAVAGDVHLCLR